jgi:hypothetical protein
MDSNELSDEVLISSSTSATEFLLIANKMLVANSASLPALSMYVPA